MGASGSAWIKPKKRTGLRPEALAGVPHPRFVRAGQRFFPLRSQARNRVTLRVTRVLGERCEMRGEDAERTVSRVSTARLLAVDGDGAPRHYRFVGYAPRAGYPTHAFVLRPGDDWTQVVCPEWHPALTVAVATGGLPAVAAGSWLACRGDLGAPSPARLGLHAFAPAAPDFDPGSYPEPQADAGAGPDRGRSATDIVLFVAERELGETALYVTGHVPPVAPGARIYLHTGERIHGWRTLLSVRPLPNGAAIELDAPLRRVDVPDAPSRPAAGVSGGEHGWQAWAWRSWPRAAERPLS